jgi:ABC-type branched-subunit amino acid transport system permease subunit
MTRPTRPVQALAVLLIAAAPLLLGDYPLALLTYVGLSAMVALGLVLLTGKGGLSSFGQAAYVGLGAYVSAISPCRWCWSSSASPPGPARSSPSGFPAITSRSRPWRLRSRSIFSSAGWT